MMVLSNTKKKKRILYDNTLSNGLNTLPRTVKLCEYDILNIGGNDGTECACAVGSLSFMSLLFSNHMIQLFLVSISNIFKLIIAMITNTQTQVQRHDPTASGTDRSDRINQTGDVFTEFDNIGCVLDDKIDGIGFDNHVTLGMSIFMFFLFLFF